MLVKYGANVNQADCDSLAAEIGENDLVKYLLASGADTTICAPSGRTVFQIASKVSTRRILAAAAKHEALARQHHMEPLESAWLLAHWDCPRAGRRCSYSRGERRMRWCN